MKIILDSLSKVFKSKAIRNLQNNKYLGMQMSTKDSSNKEDKEINHFSK